MDRLHIRYVGDAARFEDHVGRLVGTELERALEEVALPPDGHVCVRRLTVLVFLGRDTLTAAGSWADQVAAALSHTAAGTAGDDLIRYRRTLDVLVDMLTGVARGDLRRQWAWRLTGILPPGPIRPGALAAALVRRPELACAAVVAAASTGPLPLTAGGWVAVALAVAGLTGTGLPEARTDAGDLPGGSTLEHPLARRLPVADLAAHSREERRAVAHLLLLCAEPGLSRSAAAIDSVVDRLLTAAPEVAPSVAPPPASPAVSGPGLAVSGAGLAVSGAAPTATGQGRPAGQTGSPLAAAGGASLTGPSTSAATGPLSGTPAGPSAAMSTAMSTAAPASAPAGEPRGPVRDAPAGRAPRATAGPSGAPQGDAGPAPSPSDDIVEGSSGPVTTPIGGVFFLLRAIDLLEPLPAALARSAPGTVVGWLGARLAGAGTEDPAVRLLTADAPEPDAGPALATLAGRVTGGLRRMLRLEPGDDLAWLWHRTALIDAQPGWVEVTYCLDDVDTRIRAAGLDLDPGFVWWLGSVVRYRYA